MDQYYKPMHQPVYSQIQSSVPTNLQVQDQLPTSQLENSGAQRPGIMPYYYQHPFLHNRNLNDLERRARIGDQCIPACPAPKPESSCCISWIDWVTQNNHRSIKHILTSWKTNLNKENFPMPVGYVLQCLSSMIARQFSCCNNFSVKFFAAENRQSATQAK